MPKKGGNKKRKVDYEDDSGEELKDFIVGDESDDSIGNKNKN